MAVESLLHSGSFTAQNGDTIEVSFYSRIDLNCYPGGYTGVPAAGATVILSIWSHVGDAKMWDPPYDWITWSQIKAEPLPASDYYKYTYRLVIAANNSGSERVANIGIGLETGPVVGKLKDVPIKQLG